MTMVDLCVHIKKDKWGIVGRYCHYVDRFDSILVYEDERAPRDQILREISLKVPQVMTRLSVHKE